MRVEKALPPLDRYAPVTALAMAAASAGMVRFWASMLLPSGAALMTAVARAPVIRNTASTLPTRSTTAITGRADVYVVHRDELPHGAPPELALIDGFGATSGDEVVEVKPSGRPGEFHSRLWRVG